MSKYLKKQPEGRTVEESNSSLEKIGRGKVSIHDKKQNGLLEPLRSQHIRKPDISLNGRERCSSHIKRRNTWEERRGDDCEDRTILKGERTAGEGELLKEPEDIRLSAPEVMEPKQKMLSGLNPLCREITARGKKIGIREICEAATEHLQLIRVDGKLYYRMGTYFQKLDPAALGKLLFEQLPEEFAGALYNVSMEKVFKKLEATDLVKDWSMEEIRVRFSDFVALENGYFNVSTGDFSTDFKADREIICLTGIRADYHRTPEATPVFDAFIDRVTEGDECRREQLLDFLAVVLMTGKRAKRFYVLGVAPDSGKSTIADLLEAFFPLGSISRMDIHDMGRNFALAAVVESTVNISMDLTAEPLKQRSVSNIKVLTGEKRVQVEEKFKQPKVVNCCGKIVFGTNHPLVLAKPDPAFYNRLEVIPFTKQIPPEEQNPELLDQLLAELDGIVSKLLRRTIGLCERNLELSPCMLATKMKDEWMRQSEGLAAAFVREFCVVTNNRNDFLTCSELYDRYETYCEEHYEIPEAINVFTRHVRQMISSECGRLPNTKRVEKSELGVRVMYGIAWKS